MAAFDLNTPLGQALVSTGQGLGYDSDHIAGALGTAMTESGMNPGNTSGDNGASWGGFQWQGPRLQKLQQFAAAQGKSWQDPNLQAQFWYQEHNGPEAGAGFNDASGINGITNSVLASQRPQGWNSDPAVGQKYLSNILLARQALGKANGGDPSNAMAYAGNDSGSPAMGAINGALTEGRTGSTGTLAQPTSGDTSAINQMLSRYTGKGQELGAPQDPANPVENFGNGLTRLGAAFMMRDNPYSAQTMLSGIKAQTKATTNKDIGEAPSGKGRTYQKPDGTYGYAPYSDDAQKTEDPDASRIKPSPGIAKQFNLDTTSMKNTGDLISDVNSLEKLIVENDLKMSVLDTGVAEFKNSAGMADPSSAAIKEAQRLQNRIKFEYLKQEPGATTKQKIQQAGEIMFPAGSQYSTPTYLKSIEDAKTSLLNHYTTLKDDRDIKTSAYKGLGTGTVTTNDGQTMPADEYHQQNFDKWNQFTQDFAPKRSAYIQRKLAGEQQGRSGATTPRPSFLDFGLKFGGAQPTQQQPTDFSNQNNLP